VREIARVLVSGGTASISVYYRNGILRAWPLLSWAGAVIQACGGALKGRGREHIFTIRNTDDLIRCYDGADNPVGKCYSRQQFHFLLQPYFEVRETFLHFFPARAMPVRIPHALHKVLDRQRGFLIYANVVKR